MSAKPRRFTLLPALLTMTMLAVLLGLGSWQLSRAAWKRDLLADLATNASLPAIDFAGGQQPGLNFRQARVRCAIDDRRPEAVAGENRDGQSGFSHRVRCQRGAVGLLVDIGWARRFQTTTPLSFDRTFTGVLVDRSTSNQTPVPRYVLIATEPLSPFLASAPPTLASIPNNHLSYAIQWFSFAGILVVIYGLYAWRASRRPTTIDARPDSD